MTEMYVHADSGDQPTGTTGDTSSVATATMEKVSQEAGDLREQAGSEAGAVVNTAKEQALSVADEAKQRFKGEADKTTQRAASALSQSAQELSSMAASVEDPGPAAQLVQKAGQRVDDVAERIRQGGYEGIARDVTRWARQNPGIFVLAAASAGFVVGRVFRSVDPKSVADAARGNSTDAVDTREAMPGALTSTPPQDTVSGIGSMSPAAGAAPAYAPQPHPDEPVPVVDLTTGMPDPVIPETGAGGPGIAGGAR